MPEINNKINTEAQFVLPVRTFNAWRIVVPVLLVIALAGGWFARALVPSAEAPEAVVIPQEQEEETPLQTTAYYSTTDSEPDSKVTHIYSYSGVSSIPDVKVGDVQSNTLRPSGKYLEPYTYVVQTDGGKVQVFNAAKAQLTPLFEINSQEIIRNTAVSSDKKWLAYGLNYEGSENGKSGGEIWLFNIETKEKKQVVKKTELGLYQGFSILGWRNSDQELIVSALGGDGPGVWGDIYQVNVVTGAITKVTPAELDENAMNYFIRGALSPDANVWLFTYCKKIDTDSDGLFVASEPCVSGAELRTYNFATKEIKNVYQNLRYGNNADKNMLRSILSFMWQDDKTIVAAVPGVILEINALGENKTIELLTYDRTNPQNFKSNYVRLIASNGEQIVFSRENGPQIFDRVSKKIEVLNIDDQDENFGSWLD